MRIFDAAAKQAVRQVIDAHASELRSIPGFVDAEPGFPIIDGEVQREPAILVFVSHKKPPTHLLREERAPRQLGEYRVAVMQADPIRQLMAVGGFESLAASVTASSSGLTYEPIVGSPINDEFEVLAPMLCHVGPDAGWPVLRPFLEATQATLSIAMYDFNADYIAKTFIDTIRSKQIDTVLTWDDSMTAPERAIRGKLKSSLSGLLDGWVVQCGSGRRFASAYHPKIAVRDSAAFWLSSGNWSLRSQPDIDPIGNPSAARGMYGKGNREWHVIVEDAKLAALFERYIAYDRDGSKQEAENGSPDATLELEDTEHLPDVFVPIDAWIGELELATEIAEPVAPAILPVAARPIKVLPVLTPDNYLPRILELFAGAERSIYLQYSYINYSEAIKDEPFRAMLAVLADLSYRPRMDVRIIVGSNGAADKIRKLAESGFNDKVFRTQRDVHNKGIIVDGTIVLISSANWSSDGVLRNRDAGLIIHDATIADYYQRVFLDDWDNRARARLADDPPAVLAAEGADSPAGMVRMSWRDYFG